MADGGEISIAIDQADPEDSRSSLYCMHRVPKSLCVAGEYQFKYRPCVISIGPYHRRQHMQVNASHKQVYVNSLISRVVEVRNLQISSMEIHGKMASKVGEWLWLARKCYAGEVSLGDEEFIGMLMEDGCFILELLLKYRNEKENVAEDMVFNQNWLVPYIRKDLVLLENQIPFFVLEILVTILIDYEMTQDEFRRMNPNPTTHPEPTTSRLTHLRKPIGTGQCLNGPNSVAIVLRELITYFFSPILPTTFGVNLSIRGDHLLDYLRKHLLQQADPNLRKHFLQLEEDYTSRECLAQLDPDVFAQLELPSIELPTSIDFLEKYLRQQADPDPPTPLASRDNIGDRILWAQTTCATDLQEAGVRFKVKENCRSLLDITFANGEFEIPPFYFGVSWTTLFPNMIALEQCNSGYGDEITSYAILMDNLINSSDDVKLLRRRGVILGSNKEDKEIADTVNQLSKEAFVNNYFYNHLCHRVNAYRGGTIATWRADFMRKYIHTPWASISVVAGTLLLVLTVAQTVFTILSWKNSILVSPAHPG